MPEVDLVLIHYIFVTSMHINFYPLDFEYTCVMYSKDVPVRIVTNNLLSSIHTSTVQHKVIHARGPVVYHVTYIPITKHYII